MREIKEINSSARGADCRVACHSDRPLSLVGLEDEDDDDLAAPAPRQEQRQDRDMDDALDEEDEFADFLDYDDEGGAPGEGRRLRRERAQGLPPGVSSAALLVRMHYSMCCHTGGL